MSSYFNEVGEGMFDPCIGFKLPIQINKYDDYDKKIFEELDRYVHTVAEKSKESTEVNLKKINEVVNHIKKAIQCERNCNTEEAKAHIKTIIDTYSSDPFFVCELDHNFAFRATAASKDLQREGINLKAQESIPLSFFRMRSGHHKVQKDLQYIPKSRISLCSSTRYSLPGFPCLYLATSSYCAWMETGKPAEVSISGYRPTDYGKKLKILNLVNTSRLQTGFYNSGYDINECNKERNRNIYTSAITLFPLVMAASVTVKNPSDNVGYHPEYTISHLIMQCLKSCKIDGVAYLSARVDDDVAFPLCVNLALPAFDDNRLCQSFKMTQPYVPFDWFNKGTVLDECTDSKSYTNSCFNDCAHILYNCICIRYDTTIFSILDNYLEEKPHYPMECCN